MKILEITTTKRNEFIEVTSQIQKAVSEEKLKNGVCIVFCPHTTAALTINENADPSVKKDILNHLDKLAPANARYSHAEGNADSHIKSSLLGSSLNVIIEEGSLSLGTWQGIYFCEFDGPRKRMLYVKVIKDA